MVITIQENLVLRNSNKVGQKNQAITQLSFIQPIPNPFWDRYQTEKGLTS